MAHMFSIDYAEKLTKGSRSEIIYEHKYFSLTSVKGTLVQLYSNSSENACSESP